MPDELINRLIDTLPDVLWVILAAVALMMFRRPLADLLTRSTRLKVGSLELEAKALIDKSARQLPKSMVRGASNAQMLRLRAHWAGLPERVRPYRMLVAHHRFDEAKPIQRAFLDLGFDADIALCPGNIERALRKHAYDAVVSNIKWDACEDLPDQQGNGVEFLEHAVAHGFDQPTVFFIADYDPKLGVPTNSFGISNNWYDVLESVFAIIKNRADDKPG